MLGSKLLRVTAVAALAVSVSAGTAEAKAVDHWQWSEDRAFTVDDCGMTIDIADHFEGNGIARASKSDPDIVLAQYTTQFDAVWTNPANGAWFTLHQQSVFKEGQLVPLGDGLYSYSVRQAGQPFRVTDSSGNVVLRDTGLITFAGVYDATTDEVVSFDMSGMAGPHPGFFTDLCDVANDLLS